MVQEHCVDCDHKAKCQMRKGGMTLACSDFQNKEYIQRKCGHSSKFLVQPPVTPHCKRLDLYVMSAPWCSECLRIQELEERVARIVVERGCPSCEHKEPKRACWLCQNDLGGGACEERKECFKTSRRLYFKLKQIDHPCIGCSEPSYEHWQQRKDGG